MDPARARKLGERIAQIVAEMLERRIKDPRLGFITVTAARLTGDLRDATVYYTVYGSAQDRDQTAAALASAAGLIRSEVGRQTGLKHTPSITFVPDTVPDSARSIEEAMARAREADAAVAAARQGAVPAGDADPYKPAPAADEAAADEPAADEAAADEPAADEAAADEAAADEPAADEPAADDGWGTAVADGEHRRAGNGRASDPAGSAGVADGHLGESPASADRGAGYSPS